MTGSAADGRSVTRSTPSAARTGSGGIAPHALIALAASIRGLLRTGG
ncbi:hypothetical protein ACFV1L_17080 [Kitasatospora sp. NPDC059646]